MAVNWKNEWSNSAYESVSSQVIEKDKKTFNREEDKKKYAFDDHSGDVWGAAGGGAIAGAAIGTAILPGLGTLLGALFGGLFGGMSTQMAIASKRIQHDAYLEKLLDAKEDLTDSYNNYVDKWNLATKQQLENLNATNTNLQETANITIENRDATLEVNANSLYEQGQMYTTQLEQMQVNNARSEGKALQNVATSGFRNTGTAMNNVEEVQRVNAREYAVEKSKVQLSQYQNIVEAGNAYKNSTYTAYGYMGNVAENNRLFNQYMEEQELNYNQAKSEYEKEVKRYEEDLKDLKDVEWDTNYGWEGFLNTINAGLSFLDTSKIASNFG